MNGSSASCDAQRLRIFDDAAALRALNDSLETSGLSKLMDYSIARVWDATVPAPEFTPAEVEQLNKLGESKAGLAFVAFFRGPYVDVVKGIHNGGASAVMVEECKRR